MKGMVFTEFLEMVEEKFSPEMAERIIESSELKSSGVYTTVGTYDHHEMITLVISLSRETGKATEFIVVMSGEPQGGIKIRRRMSPEVRSYRARPSYGASPFGWGGGPSWW